MVFDQGEGSAILTPSLRRAGVERACAPWDRLVKLDAKRPVKIEGGLSQ